MTVIKTNYDRRRRMRASLSRMNGAVKGFGLVCTRGQTGRKDGRHREKTKYAMSACNNCAEHLYALTLT